MCWRSEHHQRHGSPWQHHGKAVRGALSSAWDITAKASIKTRITNTRPGSIGIIGRIILFLSIQFSLQLGLHLPLLLQEHRVHLYGPIPRVPVHRGHLQLQTLGACVVGLGKNATNCANCTKRGDREVRFSLQEERYSPVRTGP